MGEKTISDAEKKMKIVEKYFSKKPAWHRLSEEEAKELSALLNQGLVI